MFDIRIIEAYKHILKAWNGNCDRLQELESCETRTNILNYNMGLSYAMNMIAGQFEFDSHVEFTLALKEAGYLE